MQAWTGLGGVGCYGSALVTADTTLLATAQNSCLDMCVTQFQDNSETEVQVAGGLVELMISLCSLSC